MKTSRFTALTFQAGEKSKQQSIAIFCVQSEYYKREGNLSANSGSLTLTALVVKGLQMSASTLQTQTAGWHQSESVRQLQASCLDSCRTDKLV